MKRAGIYLRVSTAAQATRGREPEGYSIPAQREACQAKAAELDAEVVAEYVDRGESAKTADRPELKALLARLDAQRDLDLVIVHKVDRLARNRYDDATITYALHEAGVALVSVTENIDSTPPGPLCTPSSPPTRSSTRPTWRLRRRRALSRRRKPGVPAPGAARLSQRPQADRGAGNPHGRDRPRASPAHQLGLRRLRFRCPHARHAARLSPSAAFAPGPTPKKPKKPLSRTQLASMLQNPHYVGVVRYAGVEYEGRHEHLIDERTFAQAKAVLTAHANSSEKDRKHHHYLKGSLYCGRCGSRMSLTYAKGNGGRYPYFFCLGRTRGTGCKQPYVPVDLIETAVERAYGDVRLSGDQARAGAREAASCLLRRGGPG